MSVIYSKPILVCIFKYLFSYLITIILGFLNLHFVCSAMVQVPGDVTEDGTITFADFHIVRSQLMDDVALTTDQLTLDDANQDSKFDIADLVWIVNNIGVTSSTQVIGSAGGTVTFDGISADIPADFFMGDTNVSIGVDPIVQVLGKDQVSATYFIQFPQVSINRVWLKEQADKARILGTEARENHDAEPKTLNNSTLISLNLLNPWRTVDGSFSVAVSLVDATDQRVYHLERNIQVTLTNIDINLAAEIVEGLRSIAGGSVCLGFQVIHTTGLNEISSYELRLGDGTDPRRISQPVMLPPDLSDAPQPHRNVVIFVHGTHGYYWQWKQTIEGLIGRNGNSPDPAIPEDIRLDLGVWLVQYYFHRDVDANAQQLADFIQDVTAINPEIENIYIVSHSIGGVITRKAIQAGMDGTPHTGGLRHTWIDKLRADVYAGTMHDGTGIQAFGSAILNEMYHDIDIMAVDRLYADSPGMSDLSEDIPADLGLLPTSRHGVITTDIPSPLLDLLYWDEPNDGWVPFTSANDEDRSDFGIAGLSFIKTWRSNQSKDTEWVKENIGGGHIRMFPTPDDGLANSNGRTVSQIREDLRYQNVRNALFPPIPSPGDELTIMLPGGVPLELVRIPAGTFLMGRYPGERDSDGPEAPRHTVNIAYDFYMGKYELTKRQWVAVMGSTPWTDYPFIFDHPDSPAVLISWTNAKQYVIELNAHITNSGQGSATMRLPSEAEWEYACRAGTDTRFYWGEDPSYNQISDYAWCQVNASDPGEKYAHVVGQKLPNAWGLYDMSGNADEWCDDDWHSDYNGAPTDGSAWGDRSTFLRVHRGGDVVNDIRGTRSAFRWYSPTYWTTDYSGFRLVLVR